MNFRNWICILVSIIDIMSTCRAAVVPVPTVRLVRDSCTDWAVNLVYTATEMPDDVLNQLAAYNRFHTWQGFPWGVLPGSVAKWHAEWFMSGTPAEKLGYINLHIFGTRTPRPGSQTGGELVESNTNGVCAADAGVTPCIGVLVAYDDSWQYSHEPTTFPSGSCVPVFTTTPRPPVNTGCAFSYPSAEISLGTGPEGVRTGNVAIQVKCSRETTFKLVEVDDPGPETGVHYLRLSANGDPLPAVIRGGPGNNTIDLGVAADLYGAGFSMFSRTMVIEMP